MFALIFPVFGIRFSAVRCRVTTIVRLAKDGCRCRCADLRRRDRVGGSLPLPPCRSGGRVVYAASPRRQFRRHLQSAVLRGGGRQRGQAAPSPKCRSGEGCGILGAQAQLGRHCLRPAMGRASGEGVCAASAWWGWQLPPLHLSAVTATPALLCCSAWREGRRGFAELVPWAAPCP